MEDLRGCSRIADLDVMFGAKLQIPLKPGGRMFGSLAFKTVR
jgi:hypothetical protein